MDITLLTKIGLTENESKVYMALVTLGESTATNIIHKAKISSGKIYETLDKLHQKGLVSTSQIQGIKHFQTTKPEALTTFVQEQEKALKERKEEINKLIPQLYELHRKEEKQFVSEILIGTRSIQPLMKELFEQSQNTIYVMGIRGNKNETYNNFWWHLTNDIVQKQKKKAKYLFTENSSEYFKKHLKLTQPEIRSSKGLSPNAIDIIDNHVIIFTYEEELKCVHIENEGIAVSFRTFFESLWNQAKKEN